MAALQVALLVAVLCTSVFAQREDYPAPSNLKVLPDIKNIKDSGKVRANVEWEFDGADYAFFKVSWGVVGRYPTVVQTAIKSLTIDELEQNVPYTLQVDAYFPVEGTNVAKSFANVSFGPITAFAAPTNLKVHLDTRNAVDGEKGHAKVEWEFEGTDYSFFKVSWGVVGRYPTVVQTAIKSLTIDELEMNVPYTLQVDAYFPVGGKDVAKTFANVSFGPIKAYPAPTNLKVHVDAENGGRSDKVRATVMWEFEGTDYSFFKVSWGVAGRYPQAVQTAIKSLTIDTLEPNVPYTLQVEAYFPVNGKDIARTFSNVSFGPGTAYPAPTNLKVQLDAKNLKDGDKARAKVQWEFDGTDYSFFKVSWGVVGQYPTVVQTPIKSLIIDALGQNVPYALQVDAYFAVDGKDVAKTFANVSFGPITAYPAPANLKVHLDSENGVAGDKARASVEWDFEGTNFSFFRVSWGVVGRYPTVVQTAIKSLTIDTLEPNVPYTVQVDAYFPIDGKDVAKTFANVSFGPIRAYPTPKALKVDLDTGNMNNGDNARANVQWEFDGSDYSFFKVSWGVVGRYPTVVQTAIKSLTIDNLEPNVPYTLQVDAYFPVDGKDVAKTFANVSFGPIIAYPVPTKLKVNLDTKNVKEGDKVRANVEWEFEGTGYSFFRVSWGVIGRYPTVVQTAIKSLAIDNLEQNVSYTLRVDAYFPVGGKDVAQTFANAPFDVLRTLPRPSDVQVANLNYSMVLLGWKVDTPKDSLVDTSDFKYAVTYRSEGQKPTSIVVNTTTLALEGLERSTNYTVTIITMMENWKNSTMRPSSFVTRKDDWSPAVMQNATLISNGTEAVATYDFAWDFPQITDEHDFYVVVCTQECRDIPVGFNEKHLQYPLPYYTDYSVTVKTVYSLPLNQTVVKLSNTKKGKTTVGVPGPVDFQNIEQQLNNLLLKWEPPKVTRGPVSYYEVKASDAFDPESENLERVNGTDAELALPPLNPEMTYNLTVVAVAVDETTGTVFRGPIEKAYLRKLELLDPPKDVRRVGCSSDSVEIEITPPSDLKGILYQILWDEGSMWGHGKMQKAGNLKPHQYVHINVSSCIDNVPGAPSCGKQFTLETWSNSGNPEKVKNFVAEATKNNSITISWEAPAVTNGPLKGYIVKIFETGAPGASLQNFTLLPSDLTYEIADTKVGTMYNVTVAAFDEDEITHEPVIGKLSSLEVRTPGTGGWVVPVVVLVTLAVVGVGAGGFYYYRKRMLASNTPMMTLSFFNGRTDNQHTVLINE